ncbi:putative integral membrane protein [Actinacidiphila reveromycinica]|uniref:Putative integral membrane protein n=1 Tax=Actinacidiphila reveromycinica TaxID=659352 RepID=A0A7U3VPK6_9ACTN|nr:MHYT domain-containing protein [Streptomyces sp. SN-593]BBA98795.1 putative integral membrane protein [Streptomyces sp. SN-593]
MTHHAQLWSNSWYPATGYLIAFVGSVLGLSCASRLHVVGLARGKGWLAAGAISLGTGIWGMHFVAMLGYEVDGTDLHYEIGVTVLSWLLAVVVVGVGMYVAGRVDSWLYLLGGGLIAGFGVAGMHYLGMRAIRMPGSLSYDPGLVALSVLIAVVAATAALWATLRVRSRVAITGAALVMAFAISAMHYTGMEAVTATTDGSGSDSVGGVSPSAFVLPLIVGLTLIILLVSFAVLMNTLDDVAADQR